MISILCSEKLAVCLLKAWLTARTPAHMSHTERTECGFKWTKPVKQNLSIGTVVYSATDVAGWLSHCNFTCWSQKSSRCWVMHANVTKWEKMCVCVYGITMNIGSNYDTSTHGNLHYYIWSHC